MVEDSVQLGSINSCAETETGDPLGGGSSEFPHRRDYVRLTHDLAEIRTVWRCGKLFGLVLRFNDFILSSIFMDTLLELLF